MIKKILVHKKRKNFVNLFYDLMMVREEDYSFAEKR